MRYQPIPFITLLLLFIVLPSQAHDKRKDKMLPVSQVLESQYETDEDDDIADAPEIPVSSNMQLLAAESKKRDVPILLMFSAEDCDYCERLEEDIVHPMLLSGEFDERIIFRKVMIDGTEQLKDFRGNEKDPEVYADKLNVQVTPTLVFFDNKGKELVPKVVGYQMGGLFMAYLDLAINASQQAMHDSQDALAETAPKKYRKKRSLLKRGRRQYQ